MSKYTLSLALLLLASWLVLVPTVAAQDDAGTQTVTDDEVNEIAEDLFCPVCESTPLDVCPTQACADWRALIREMLAEGKSEQEINEYFARQYGDGVLADPPRRGFNLVLWFFPIVAVIVGGVFFGRYISQIRSGDVVEDDEAEMETSAESGTSAPKANANDDYVSRVEEELKSA